MIDFRAVFNELPGEPDKKAISIAYVLNVTIHAVLRGNQPKNTCLRAFQRTFIRRISPCS
jgi:hypothetical protein